MLDNKTIEIIKSTVPVLQQHGETITGSFYDRMFQDHPELLNIFNQTNQKKKTQRTALANAVIAAAANIDQLGNIIPVVKQPTTSTAVSELSLSTTQSSVNIC